MTGKTQVQEAVRAGRVLEKLDTTYPQLVHFSSRVGETDTILIKSARQ